MQCKEELLLDIVKRRYDAELQRTKDLDTKAGNLIGYVTIVTGLIVGLGTFSILEKLSFPQYYIPYLLGVGALLFSIITFPICPTGGFMGIQWCHKPYRELLQGFQEDKQFDCSGNVLFHDSSNSKEFN